MVSSHGKCGTIHNVVGGVLHVMLLASLCPTRYVHGDENFQSTKIRRSTPTPDYDHSLDLPTRRPLIIAHRGSCGILPEHTREAYTRAIEDGADVIECDVVATQDQHFVCRHDPWLSD